MFITINPADMQQKLFGLFSALGFTPENAQLLAKAHTESTMCGVNSHGINRVPLFTKYVRQGIISVNAQAKKIQAMGAIERWDGQLGSGVVNATACTERAIGLAQQHGMGLVALKNTNHWMRAGSYGWQAAEQGCIGIMFTNTQANMPPWGAAQSRIGNNPLVIAIPYESGHIVLDMAMSQFSFGKIHEYYLKGETLPFPGGWDANNQLSSDPKPILQSEKAMPTGYWKGSALSLVLDMLATLLSAGQSTGQISQQPIETGISQIFMCIDTKKFANPALITKVIDEIVAYTSDVELINADRPVKYPGQRALATYQQSKQQGMQVSQDVWSKVQALCDEHA